MTERSRHFTRIFLSRIFAYGKIRENKTHAKISELTVNGCWVGWRHDVFGLDSVGINDAIFQEQIDRF